MDNVEQECCECDCGCDEDCEDCAEVGEALGEVAQAADTYALALAELAEMRRRLGRLEDAFQMLAKRRICALMTDVDALERYVLARQVTTADLKKAGLRAMGLERKG